MCVPPASAGAAFHRPADRIKRRPTVVSTFFFDARNVDQLSQGTTWLASDVVAVPTHLPQSDQSRSRDFYLQRCRSWKFSPVPKRSGTFWSLVIIVKGRPIVRAPRTKCARRLCQKCKLCCLQKCKLLKISDVSSRYRLFRTPFPGLLIRISEWDFHQKIQHLWLYFRGSFGEIWLSGWIVIEFRLESISFSWWTGH